MSRYPRRRFKNPLGPCPPGKATRPKRSKAREALDDEYARQYRATLR